MAGIAPVVPSPGSHNPFNNKDSHNATTTSSYARTPTDSSSMNPTTAELSQRSNNDFASATSTPGHEVPGAYPRETETQSQPQWQGNGGDKSMYETVSQLFPGSLKGSSQKDNTANTGSGVIFGANPIDNSSVNSTKEQSFPGYERLTEQGIIYGANPLDKSSLTNTDTGKSPNPFSDTSTPTPGSALDTGVSHPAQWYPSGDMNSGMGGLYVTDDRTQINNFKDDSHDMSYAPGASLADRGVVWGANPLSSTSVKPDTQQADPSANALDWSESSGVKGLNVTDERTVLNRPQDDGYGTGVPRMDDSTRTAAVPASSARGLGVGVAAATIAEAGMTPPAPASPSQLPFIASVGGTASRSQPSQTQGWQGQGATQTQGQGKTSLPSTESEGARSGELSAGAGALPGKLGEEGVGVVPDERAGAGGEKKTETKQETKQEEKREVKQPEKKVEKKEEKEEKKEKKKEGEQPKDADKQKAAGDPEKPGTKGQPNKGSGYDTDYHPAEMHPAPEKKEGDDDDAQADKEENKAREGVEEKDSEGVPAKQDADADKDKASKDSEHGDQKRHKASFMEKMKGEAKVLLGKVEGKPQKVEEGKKLKGGEA